LSSPPEKDSVLVSMLINALPPRTVYPEVRKNRSVTPAP
jgi:hypothetical protein